LVILGFSAFGTIVLDKEKGWKIKSNFSFGVFFTLLIIILSFLGLFIAKLLAVRYAIMPAIGFFLLLGYGFSRANRSWRVAAVIIFLLLSILSFSAMANVSSVDGDWKGAANFISQNEKSGDEIIGSRYWNIFLISFYYRGQLPMAAPLDEKYRGDDLLLTTIKTNIYPTTNQKNISQLKNFLEDTRRVFLLTADSGIQGTFFYSCKMTRDWLNQQGFISVQSWPPGNASSSLVWLMEKK
jgi:uncharacterized membrane protein